MSRGLVKVVIDPKLNRGKRWTQKNYRNLPIRITYLDRAGNRRVFSRIGATKYTLFADPKTTILKVEVPTGAKKGIITRLKRYGWGVA